LTGFSQSNPLPARRFAANVRWQWYGNQRECQAVEDFRCTT
jgi:hypothetical protein